VDELLIMLKKVIQDVGHRNGDFTGLAPVADKLMELGMTGAGEYVTSIMLEQQSLGAVSYLVGLYHGLKTGQNFS
jgi:hypothetical protein